MIQNIPSVVAGGTGSENDTPMFFFISDGLMIGLLSDSRSSECNFHLIDAPSKVCILVAHK